MRRPKQTNKRRAKSRRTALSRPLASGLLAIALSVATPGWATDNAESLLSEASSARAAGDFSIAVAKLSQLLAETPDNSDALVELGFANLALGDLTAAQDSFDRALAIAPDYSDATLGLAYVSFRRGDVDETIRLAKRTLDQAPEYQAAADLLTAAESAKRAADDAAEPPPLTRPDPRIAIPNRPKPLARPIMLDDPIAMPARRFFFSVGQRLGDQRDIDANLAVEIRKPGGVSLVYGVRHTERSYGNATQAKFALFKKARDTVVGAEFALGRGADNLPKASVGLSIASQLSDRYGYSARLTFEHFEDADVISFAPRLSFMPRERAEFSLGAIISHSSSVRGAAAVIDGRASFEVSDDLTLRIGAAHGEELDGDRMRDLRSFSFGIRRTISDDLSVTATLSSEPGRRRVDFGVVRRF